MKSYYEVGIRYDKTQENGLVKTVNERHLIDAVSFTEAESRITEAMKPYLTGGFSVMTEKISNIQEVILNDKPDHDKFYRVKLKIISIDERTAKEKATPYFLLVQACNIDEAKAMIYKRDAMMQEELEAIAETKIVSFIPYCK